jgi:hypothetical protein
MTADEFVPQRVFAALLVLLVLLALRFAPPARLAPLFPAPTAPVSFPLSASTMSEYSKAGMHLQMSEMLLLPVVPAAPAAFETVSAEALLQRALLHQALLHQARLAWPCSLVAAPSRTSSEMHRAASQGPCTDVQLR